MEHIRLRLLVASAFTLLVAACSQVPTPQTQSETPLSLQFGTRGNDDTAQVAVSTDLNTIFVAGRTPGAPLKGSEAQNDLYLRRYARNGTLEWGVQSGNPGGNSLSGLALDNRNHVYIAGYSEDYNASGYLASSGFLKQYAVDGRLIWSREVGTNAGLGTRIFGIVTDKQNSIFVAGVTEGGGFIGKYSSRGNNIWTKLYDNSGFTEIRIDQDGNLYVLTDSSVISKYTSSGHFLWETTAGGAANIFVSDMRIVGDALYVAGYKLWDPPFETDAYVAKFDLLGNRKWAKSFGTRVPDSAKAITADSHGSVYVTGTTEGVLGSKNLGGTDIIVRKYRPSGNIAWTQQFGSPKYEAGLAIAAFTSGELYVGGVTNGNLGAGKQGSDDAFLTRLNSKGNRVWTR